MAAAARCWRPGRGPRTRYAWPVVWVILSIVFEVGIVAVAIWRDPIP